MAQSKENVQAVVTILEKVQQQLDLITKSAINANKELADPKTLKDLESIEEAIEGLNEETKLFNQTKKQQATQDARLASLRKGEQNDLIKTKLAVQEETKAVRDRIKASNSLTPLLDKERKRLALMQKQLAETALRTGASSRETRKLAKSTQFLNEKILRAEKLGGTFQRQVGKYPQILGKGIIAFAGIGAGIELFRRGLGAAINIAKDFEQSNANLASVLGVSRKEIGALTEDAKRLGAATSFSASEVSGLQTEFAKLGFDQTEILNATEATLNLAAATGSDLAEAAAIAGATLGGFGLDAAETGRVTDVMAKSFSSSALDMEKFKESMKTAAPAAQAVGKSVEETTALLGTLANAGISGSKAGTSLKTTFINLNAAGLTMNQGFEKVNKSSDKLGTAVKLVGKEAAAAFLVLAGGVDETAKLQKGLENAGGAAEKMAKEQLDTLEGSLKILNSAWEGFVLGLLSGEGAFSSLSRSLVNFATSVLGVLTPSQELADTWFNQRDAVNDLESGLNPLLDRYDELKSKTELTKDEQIELDEIIQKVAEDVPSAVSAFDEYGKALGITTDAAREFIKQQKDILTIQNAEAIEEQEDAISSLNKTLGLYSSQLTKIDGDWAELQITFTKGGRAIENIVKLTDEEITRRSKLRASIKTEIDARNAIIAQLKGEKTELEKLLDVEEEETEIIEDNIKAKKGLTDAQKAFNKSLKEQISLLKEQQKEELLLAGDNELLKLELRDEHLNQINELELKFIGQTSSKKNQINAELNNDLLANDIKRVEKQAEIANKSIEEQEKLELKQLNAANKITQFRLDRAIKDAKTINEIENTSIEAAENRAEIIKQQADLSADDLILIEERLQAEIADIQKKADDDRLAEKKKADAELAKQQKEATDTAVAITNALLKKQSDARIKSFDNQLDAFEKNRDKLEDAARQGDENAVKSLAISQKRQAEITKAKEKEIQRQKELELILSGIKTYTAKVEAGDQNAVGSTLSDMALLLAGIAALPSAFDGTIDTGKGGNMDNKGGFLGVWHPNERVVPEKINSKLGGVSNEKLGEVMQLYNKGLIMPEVLLSPAKQDRFESNKEMLAKFDSLERAIKSLPKNMPTNDSHFDTFREVLWHTSKRGSRTDKKGYSIFD